MVVESGFSSALQTELNSHELGHNLGINHTASAGLMAPGLNGGTTLTIGEVATINTGPRVQGVGPYQFIQMTPNQVVPEPCLAALFGLAGCLLVWYRSCLLALTIDLRTAGKRKQRSTVTTERDGDQLRATFPTRQQA